MITDTTTTMSKSKFSDRKSALSKIQIEVKKIVDSLDNYVHKNNNELHKIHKSHIIQQHCHHKTICNTKKKGQFITKGK